MRIPQALKLSEVAQIIHCEFRGDPNITVLGLNEIHRVAEGEIVFVDHPKYYEKALYSQATVVLINKEVEVPQGKGLLISDDPFRDFNKLINHFAPQEHLYQTISSSAQIAPTATIEPYVTIGDRVIIGENSIICTGARILADTIIGDDVIIQANSVIGSNAFYYKKRPEGYDRLLSCGNVVIENRVEIGANCTIDRGVTDTTRIGEGTKMDNHIQIGHDTQIGKNCLFAAHVGIAGCVQVGDESILWGQVGVTSGVKLGPKTVVLGQSGITKSLEGGKTYFGSPAEDARKKYKELASIRVLPEIIERITLEG